MCLYHGIGTHSSATFQLADHTTNSTWQSQPPPAKSYASAIKKYSNRQGHQGRQSNSQLMQVRAQGSIRHGFNWWVKLSKELYIRDRLRGEEQILMSPMPAFHQRDKIQVAVSRKIWRMLKSTTTSAVSNAGLLLIKILNTKFSRVSTTAIQPKDWVNGGLSFVAMRPCLKVWRKRTIDCLAN